MHQQQTKEQCQQTQALYLQLFDQAQINHQGKLQLPFNPNNATIKKAKNKRILLRGLKRLKQASTHTDTDTDSIWEDQIFATTLFGKKRLDLDVLLPKALAKAIPHGKWRTLYPRIALTVLLSVVLGGLLQQGWQRYGEQLAQNYWIENPQLHLLLANTAIIIQINQPERYKTGAEMVRIEQQKQAAKLLKNALLMQGFKGALSIKTEQGSVDNPNQLSRIRYHPQSQLAASLIGKQLKHLSWGLQPIMDSSSTQTATIQIQLHQLTQAASTFRDIARISLTAAQQIALAKPINKENPLAIQAFTHFRAPVIEANKQTQESPAKIIPMPTMIALPAGEFLMGSPNDEAQRGADESPQHSVKLKAFAISQSEITFAQYDAFAEATKRKKPDDEGWGREQRPVINVNWNDATAYVTWLSEQTGQAYRLPSEAEWEYAARAGTTTPFSTGECIHTDLANYNGGYGYNNCGAKTGVYRQKTLPVTELPANPWGLFGVHGNVWEWVEDCWHDNYDGAPLDGSAWQKRACDRRVVRGGGWGDFPVYIRSAYRNWYNLGDAINITGFRIARAL